MNEVLFKILDKLASKPELVTLIEPFKIVGKLYFNSYYTIELCCEGYGVIITLPNNSKLDFSLNQEERERFEKCISAIKKACIEVGYKSLLEYLQIETNSDSTTNKQFN